MVQEAQDNVKIFDAAVTARKSWDQFTPAEKIAAIEVTDQLSETSLKPSKEPLNIQSRIGVSAPVPRVGGVDIPVLGGLADGAINKGVDKAMDALKKEKVFLANNEQRILMNTMLNAAGYKTSGPLHEWDADSVAALKDFAKAHPEADVKINKKEQFDGGMFNRDFHQEILDGKLPPKLVKALSAQFDASKGQVLETEKGLKVKDDEAKKIADEEKRKADEKAAKEAADEKAAKDREAAKEAKKKELSAPPPPFEFSAKKKVTLIPGAGDSLGSTIKDLQQASRFLGRSNDDPEGVLGKDTLTFVREIQKRVYPNRKNTGPIIFDKAMADEVDDLVKDKKKHLSQTSSLDSPEQTAPDGQQQALAANAAANPLGNFIGHVLDGDFMKAFQDFAALVKDAPGIDAPSATTPQREGALLAQARVSISNQQGAPTKPSSPDNSSGRGQSTQLV